MTRHQVGSGREHFARIALWLLACAIPLSAQGSTGKLEGRVLDSATAKPIVAARVVIKGTAHAASTDSSGYYFFSSVPAGTYDVRASWVGYRSTEVRGARVRSGETVTQDFALSQVGPFVSHQGPGNDWIRPAVRPDGDATPSTGMLLGTIRDAHRRPIARATVIIVGTARMATADSLGRYRFEELPAGTYDVRAAYVGFAPTTLHGLRVMSGQSVTQDVTLERRSAEVDHDPREGVRGSYRVSP